MKRLLFILPVLLIACTPKATDKGFTGQDGEVKLMILEPGHFHAALLQKEMNPQIDKTVYVYAPKGDELNSYLDLIESYNTRKDSPTTWNEVPYDKEDYLIKMLEDKKGNVVVLAGNNRNKIGNIDNAISAGISVLSDKPMIISPNSFSKLVEAYNRAEENRLILYDMMTERYEVTNILQRKLMQDKELFGLLTEGTIDKPAVESKSVHHFLKMVSGKALTRPAWYYDVEQQGDGITDVTTHLIDLIMWKCFPDKAIDYKTDVKVNDANRWATKISPKEFEVSTNLKNFPNYLGKDIINDTLNVFANGNMQFQINDIQVKVDVEWKAQAPEGTGDTHRFVVRGTKADLLILQGEKENFQPKLYVKGNGSVSNNFEQTLDSSIKKLQASFPGIYVTKAYDDMFLINIPDELKLGHESHFQKVVGKFTTYLIEGKQPEWEVSNTLSKYYITTEALDIAKNK